MMLPCRLILELDKIYNGTIYTDLSYRLLQILRRLANCNRVINSTIYIAVNP